MALTPYKEYNKPKIKSLKIVSRNWSVVLSSVLSVRFYINPIVHIILRIYPIPTDHQYTHVCRGVETGEDGGIYTPQYSRILQISRPKKPSQTKPPKIYENYELNPQC